jgi:hypothetical protein
MEPESKTRPRRGRIEVDANTVAERSIGGLALNRGKPGKTGRW